MYLYCSQTKPCHFIHSESELPTELRILLRTAGVRVRCNFGSGSHLQSEDCNFFFSTLYKSISFQPYHLAVNPAPSLQTECGPAYLEPLAPGCLIAAPVSWTEAAAGHRSQVTFSADFASTGADDKCRQFYPIICFPLSRISPSSPGSGQLRPAWYWSMIRMERVGELIRSSKLYQDIQTSRHK